MPSNNDKPQITTTTQDPYGSGYINNALSEGWRLYSNSPSTAMAPINPTAQSALDQTAALAGQPVPGLQAAQNFAQGMIANNGMTPDLNRTAGYLTPFANGSMQEDPRLQQMLDANATRASNAAFTQFGGGRYGSVGIGQGVGQAVTNANNATMLQSNENARTQQLQAAGLLGNLYENGLGRAAQATSALPALNELRYDGAGRLAGIGDYLQNRDQTEWDYPWARLQPYASLVQGMGGLGNTAMSIKPTTSASGAQKAIGGAAAGASLGSAFGPWGTLVGGVGGGLLGAFG